MSNYVIADLNVALTSRLYHTITMWNRLEGRPRKDDFDRAMRAEVRDPLWMITRQWQMGEFLGDDAGSPISAKMHLATTRLNKYQPADHPVQAFDRNTPLEGRVEQRPIPLKVDEQKFSLDLRMMMGRHWNRMVKKAVADHSGFYNTEYPIEAPADPDDADQSAVLSHQESWQRFAAVAGRRMDGIRLVRHLKGGGKASDNLTLNPADQAAIDNLGGQFLSWAEQFFLQPDQDEENAWIPSKLEYQFACSAPSEGQEKVYEAEEYYSGKLDWFNFSINDQRNLEAGGLTVETNVEDTATHSFIPVAMDFEGMPDTRWWAFEDRKTYLGNITPDTTDLGKLMLMEFALVYANDWFLMPHSVKAGTITNVKGLAVTNVFGERTWIEATGMGVDDDWQRWTMFTTDIKGQDLKTADNSLLMLPTVPKIQEGDPIERIALVRDEVANMVWAIDMDIQLPSGHKKKGTEAGRETAAFFQRIEGPALPEIPPSPTAEIRYQVANRVPENWIPFIPVHKENDNREIQLQRSSMPRIIEGSAAPIRKIKPRSLLLREGLDQADKKAFFIHEEEVPRSGIHVTQAYQRTRWYGGKVFNWLGVRKTTGRGEGSSGLAFDQAV